MTAPGTQPDRDSDLARLARRHAGWQVWKAPSDRYHARMHRNPRVTAEGGDPAELDDAICAVEALMSAAQG